MKDKISLKGIEGDLRSVLNNFLIEYFNVVRREDFDWKQVVGHEQACIENIIKYFMSHYKELIEDYAEQTLRKTLRKILQEFDTKGE